MARLKFYLDTRRENAEGKYPLTLNLSYNYKSAKVPLNIKLTQDEWTEVEYAMKSLPQSRWTAMVADIFAAKTAYDAALSRILEEEGADQLSAIEIRDRLEMSVKGKSKSAVRKQKESEKNLFIARFKRFIETRETDGTRSIYSNTLKKILSYDPDAERLSFEDIDKDWLLSFDEFIKETMSQNIRNLQFRNIRAVFNDAINDGITTNYPFRQFKLPKIQETRHRALNLEQIKTLKEYPCDDWMVEYRDLFLLSLYLIGINASDLLQARKSDIVNGRLEYRRNKTHRLYSVKIEPEAQAIIDKYAGKDWLLSPLDRYASYKDYLHHWNDALKKIGTSFSSGRKTEGKALFPALSTYWARHTWATIASSLDIPVDIIGRALGHSWVNKMVTSIYIKFDNKKVDDANRSVIDAINSAIW